MLLPHSNHRRQWKDQWCSHSYFVQPPCLEIWHPIVPGNAHIRCLAHVVNLVVQKILAALDEANDLDLIDYFQQYMKSLPVHYNADNDEALKELENEDLILDANDSNDDDSDNGLFQVVEPKDGEEVLEKSTALKKVHTQGLFFHCCSSG